MGWWWYVAIALAATPQQKYTADQIAAGNKAIKATKEIVRATLKDPDSAQFRNVALFLNESGTGRVCGEVNAKNSFGGYTGFEVFYYAADTVEVVTQRTATVDGVDAETWARIVAQACHTLVYRPK